METPETISKEHSPPFPKKNEYLVWDQRIEQFVKFSIKIGQTQIGNYLDVLVLPATRQPGFLSHNKQVYFVYTNDLLRNHFNVTKPYAYPIFAGDSSPGSTPIVGSDSTSNSDKPSSKPSIGDELDKESDLFWKEQIHSLLHSENPEEGWDMAYSP